MGLKNRIQNAIGSIVGEVICVMKRVNVDDLSEFIRLLKKRRKVYIAGVGRSGLAVKAFGQRLMHLGFSVHLADEITAPAITRGDILICCSGTGTTQLILFMARKAKSLGSHVVSFTADPNSPLVRYSDSVIIVPAALSGGPTVRSVRTRQPARSLFEQALFILFDAIIMALVRELKIPPYKVSKRHANLE